MTKCPKCGYVRKPEDQAPDYECPKCGVIYAKYRPEQELPPEIKARLAREAARRKAIQADASEAQIEQPATPEREPFTPDDNLDLFVARMRAASLYPTFRELVKIIYFAWLAVAALTALGGVAMLIALRDIVGFGVFISSLFFAVLFVVIARVSRELALMLVDLSDSAVRIAAKIKP